MKSYSRFAMMPSWPTWLLIAVPRNADVGLVVAVDAFQLNARADEVVADHATGRPTRLRRHAHRRQRRHDRCGREVQKPVQTAFRTDIHARRRRLRLSHDRQRNQRSGGQQSLLHEFFPSFIQNLTSVGGAGSSPTPKANIHTTTSDVQGKRPIRGDSMATCGSNGNSVFSALARLIPGAWARITAASILVVEPDACRSAGMGTRRPKYPAALLPAAKYLGAIRRPVAGAGCRRHRQVRMRQRHIGVRCPGVQHLVHDIDVLGGPAVGVGGALTWPRSRTGRGLSIGGKRHWVDRTVESRRKISPAAVLIKPSRLPSDARQRPTARRPPALPNTADRNQSF